MANSDFLGIYIVLPLSCDWQILQIHIFKVDLQCFVTFKRLAEMEHLHFQGGSLVPYCFIGGDSKLEIPARIILLLSSVWWRWQTRIISDVVFCCFQAIGGDSKFIFSVRIYTVLWLPSIGGDGKIAFPARIYNVLLLSSVWRRWQMRIYSEYLYCFAASSDWRRW